MKTFDVRDYGAVGDGVTDDTAAIQAAVDAAAEWNRKQNEEQRRFFERVSAHWPLQLNPEGGPKIPLYRGDETVWKALHALLDIVEIETRTDDD